MIDDDDKYCQNCFEHFDDVERSLNITELCVYCDDTIEQEICMLCLGFLDELGESSQLGICSSCCHD